MNSRYGDGEERDVVLLTIATIIAHFGEYMRCLEKYIRTHSLNGVCKQG